MATGLEIIAFFVLYFLTSSLIGHDPPKIVRATERRLNTNIPSGELYYINRLEELIRKHKIVERVGQAHENSTSKASLKIKLDKIDEEQKDYMLHTEKKCRRIKSGRIPLSPDSSKWIRRAQVYRSILRFHANRIRNRSNLNRVARRCRIRNPLSVALS